MDPSFEVEAGRGKAFNAKLELLPPPSPNCTTGGKEAVDAPKAQLPFSLFPEQQLPVVYSFAIKLQRHGFRKRANWVANFVDGKNYVEYEIDDKILKYTIRQNGKEAQSKSVPHSIAGKDDFYNVAVSVSSNQIVVSSAGKVIDTPMPAGADNLPAGKFGFPQGEIWENFQFTTCK